MSNLVKLDTEYGPCYVDLSTVEAITAPFPTGFDKHLTRAMILNSGQKVHFSETPENLDVLKSIASQLEPMPKPKPKGKPGRKPKAQAQEDDGA